MKLSGNNTRYLSAELLIEPIDVYQPSQAVDGEGGYTVTYVNTGTIWGMFIPLGEDRSLIAAQVSYTAPARVYVRYPLTIDSTYKLSINGHLWTIHSIHDLENRHEYFEILIYK